MLKEFFLSIDWGLFFSNLGVFLGYGAGFFVVFGLGYFTRDIVISYEETETDMDEMDTNNQEEADLVEYLQEWV